MLLEQANGGIVINMFGEEVSTNYSIKAIRNITFQYPMLAYVWGTKELWIQDLNNNVSIYYFDATIAAMENISSVLTQKEPKLNLGIVLDYGEYLQTARTVCNNSENTLIFDKRRIKKDEYLGGKIKGFYRIKLQNPETKSVENAVMLHLKKTLVILSLEYSNIKYEVKKNVNKANVIFMQKTNAIIFWADKGDKLEMMKLPYDPNSPKSIVKVFEADEEIRYCKLTHIEGREYIALIDEPKYVKILKVEDSQTQKFNKVSLYKDYFVDTYFSTTNDVQGMKNYGFCKEMMYSSSGAYVLQEKGKEKEGKFNALYYSQYSLDYGTTKFPMCSEDFILYSLSPEYDNTYTYQTQYLLLGNFNL